MNVLKMEECLLPNSRWLQKLLKHQVHIFEGMMDEEWQKAVNAEPEYIQKCKTELEILTPVLKQCTKSGKYVILTKTQWDGIHNILDEIRGFISKRNSGIK